MKQLAFSLVILLVASCAPTGENLKKLGVTAPERAHDVEYCQTYALAVTPPSTMDAIAGIADIMGREAAQFKLCMMDRGYSPT